MTTEVSTDKAAIAAVPQRVVEAWAKQDAAAFAGVFTADGTLILPGLFLKGQDDIRAYMSQAFEGPFKGTRVTGQPIDLRVHGDLGIVVTQGGVLAPGDAEVTPERAIRATWIVIKDDGEWRLAAYQNSPVNTPS
ncbi:SgcJ/EcaC family oxidoreductase [Micromonospora sp. NPDC004704]